MHSFTLPRAEDRLTGQKGQQGGTVYNPPRHDSFFALLIQAEGEVPGYTNSFVRTVGERVTLFCNTSVLVAEEDEGIKVHAGGGLFKC